MTPLIQLKRGFYIDPKKVDAIYTELQHSTTGIYNVKILSGKRTLNVGDYYSYETATEQLDQMVRTLEVYRA